MNAPSGDVLDHALAELVDSHFLEKRGTAVFSRLFQKFAPRNNDVLALLVDLENLQIVFLADEFVHVLDRTDIDLGSGQEGFDAVEVDDDAAFDAVFHEPLDHAAFAVFGSNLLPGLDKIGLGETDFGHIAFIFDRFEEHIQLFADLDHLPVPEFRAGHDLPLLTDVNKAPSVFSQLFCRNEDPSAKLLQLARREELFHGEVVAQIDVASGVFFCFCCHFLFSVLIGCLVRKLPVWRHSRRPHTSIHKKIR